MKTPAVNLLMFITAICLSAFSIGISRPLPRPVDTEVVPVAPRSASSEPAVRFSSVYTNLTNCGSGLTRRQEKELEAQGSDIPTKCKGYGGYDVMVSYSACNSSIRVEKGETSIPLATQALQYPQKNLEWRLANGKPFGVIMRVYKYAGTPECEIGGKTTGSSLIVKGLKGYESIDQTVDAGTSNANVKAREIADKAYGQP